MHADQCRLLRDGARPRRSIDVGRTGLDNIGFDSIRLGGLGLVSLGLVASDSSVSEYVRSDS